MFTREDIITNFKNNGLGEIEEIKNDKEVLVFRFSYIFDEVELKAAEAFANEECEEEKEGEAWNYEFFLPYLNDIAIDNVNEIVEECAEEIELGFQFIALDVPVDNPTYNDFLVVFHEEEKEIELEDFLSYVM